MERIAEHEPAGPAGWNDMLADHQDGWRDKDYRQLASLFRLDRLQGDLLDVGCAVGDGFDVLGSVGGRIAPLFGCDFSPEGIRIAAERVPTVELFVHDIHQPLPRTWSTIISLQTVEHLADPTTAVVNMAAAASDTLIVATPYRNRRPDADHCWSFDETDFTQIFDGWLLDRPQRNIYWYRSTVAGLVRPALEVTASALGAGAARRLRRTRDRLIRPRS